jgi:hypothetical protein
MEVFQNLQDASMKHFIRCNVGNVEFQVCLTVKLIELLDKLGDRT